MANISARDQIGRSVGQYTSQKMDLHKLETHFLPKVPTHVSIESKAPEEICYLKRLEMARKLIIGNTLFGNES